MFVRIDMEASRDTDATLAIWRGLQREGRARVGVVLQAMLRRTVDDARALARDGAPVRVCKGIYREPAAIAYQDADAVRASYLETVRVLLAGGSKVAVATHDERLIDAVWKLVDDTGANALVEQQMLLGVREALRGELTADGRPVRVYVPYGARWYEYSLRRLQENPKVAGHVARAALGLGALGAPRAAERPQREGEHAGQRDRRAAQRSCPLRCRCDGSLLRCRRRRLARGRRCDQVVLGGQARAQLAAPLRLGVDLGAEQERHRAQPEPRHQHDHGGERPPGLVVGLERRDVQREPGRGDQPDERRRARCPGRGC